MYGPHLKVNRQKKQAYLIAFLDDASRLVPYSLFTLSQNFEALRLVLKEAVLRRGVPKMLYTDNGKIYRSQQLSMICASIGCSLIHAEPFTPSSKGKIERFFSTVRTRFLEPHQYQFKDLQQLNNLYWEWLDKDYHRKEHSALKKTPLEFFMEQTERVRLFTDPAVLEEHFLLRVTRKVHHDATLQLENVLFETHSKLANMSVEIRYDPEWFLQPNKPLLLYKDSAKIGEARLVKVHDNAHVKRKKSGQKSQSIIEDSQEPTVAESILPKAKHAISFSHMEPNPTQEAKVSEVHTIF